MLGNWIRQTTTTTGIGNLTLAAVTGYAAFSDYFAASQRFLYAIVDDSTGAPIEAGIGHLSAGALVREVPTATIVSGTLDISNPSAVSLGAGTKRVICTSLASAQDAPWEGLWSATTKVYGDAGIVSSTSTLALTADRAYYVKFKREVQREIDAIVFNVTTAGAAGRLAIGAIYPLGTDGLPVVSAPLATTGSVAVDGSTGLRTMTFTRFMPPPRFVVALLSDGAPTVTSSTGGIMAGDAFGFGASFVPNSFVHHVGATGLTLPASLTPVGNPSNTNRPIIGVRVA